MGVNWLGAAQYPNTTIGDVLKVDNSNLGLDATYRQMSCGAGTNSPLYISTTGVSVPGSGANSEAFGNGASTSTSGNNTAIGNGATATASSGNCTAVGRAATCSAGAQATAIGSSAAAGVYCTAVGYLATATAGQFGLALGQNSNCGHNYSIAFGAGAVTTAANQLMVGQPTSGNGAYITQVKFPNTTSGAGTDVSILGSSAGSGNSKGGNQTIRGGAPAGTGSPGSVIVSYSAALATTDTSGFLYIPTCAGTPSGTPESITGGVPLVFDTTGVKLWIYTGGAWKGVVVA